jgi:hypothetical protein
MAVFTAISALVTAIGTAIGLGGAALTVFTAVGSTLLSVGVSSLIAKRMQKSAASGLGAGQGGGRVQLPPATDNKIPVVYGSGYVSGPVIDAKLSQDQQYMWYVVALAEVTDTGGYTFDVNNIYYDGKKVEFGANGNVTGLINNTTPQTIDRKVSGKIKIWLFTDGSLNPQNTTQTAIDILSDSSTGGGIPSGEQWTGTDLMTKCAFAIIRVEYNTDAGTTSLGALQARIINSLDKPGDVIADYLQNTRYGCAVPASRIDTASLTALNTYSDETINYGTGTQARYRINGPLATNISCLENLQILVDSTDSWLQYSELTAKWSVVINQSYTDYTTINNLFLVDSSNLIGGINVAPINLNETYNQMEVAYPNQYIRDQIDYQVIELEDYQVGVMSPNEAVNKLDIDFPVINNSVQALYVGVRRLLQSREDLTITCKLDYSGIQIEAGDVIRVKQEVYGWDVLNPDPLDPSTTYGKLFRVASVAEEKYQDGSLGVSITAFEYNDTIYADRALLDFRPDPNTGLADPNLIDTPEAPDLFLNTDGTIAFLNVTGIVPNTGLVNYLEFQYGTNSNAELHSFYTSAYNADGSPLTGDLDAANISIGQEYRINTLGNSSFETFGANLINLAAQPNLGSYLRPGKEYIIHTSGNTNWVGSGASANTVGTVFTANDDVLATGSGKALETTFIANNSGSGNGIVNTAYTITMTDLPENTYYWSVKARNDQVGVNSPSAGPIQWLGPNITDYYSEEICNVIGNTSSTTLTFSPPNDNLCLGGNLSLIQGFNGQSLAANTYITEIVSNTEIIISTAPTSNFDANLAVPACLQVTCLNPDNGEPAGGINGNNIQDGSISFDKIGTGIQGVYDVTGWQIQQLENGNVVITVPGFYSINDPAYISSVVGAIPSTKYYPFFQGTSSTADGYAANSTGVLAGAGAAFYMATVGTGGWFPFALTPILTREDIDETGQLLNVQLVSDSNCTVQIAPYSSSYDTPTTISINTQFIDTVQLTANKPTNYEIEAWYVSEGGDSTVSGYAYRLLENGPIVWNTSGTLRTYQRKR